MIENCVSWGGKSARGWTSHEAKW